MPVSPTVSSSRRVIWSYVVPAAIAFAYAGAHLVWYLQTPLGQVPVLDEQENLAFAEAIARGALPHEPFYRAPGYALLLAVLRGIGVPPDGLFHAALVLGTVLHAVNALLIARIARDLFRHDAAAWIAGLLFALNPVLVHYSTQALDAVPALTLFLFGLCWLSPWLRRTNEESTKTVHWWVWGALGSCWAAASMSRPNYLVLWCVLPAFAALSRIGRWRAVIATVVGGGVIFASIAGWQWRVSGEARVLPWQGPFNLWAANQPGAHGRYYVQQHTLPASVAKLNPARADSMYLYAQEKGAPAPDIDALNAHWRGRFIARVTQHPLSWLGQLARKTYALLNAWEQYNNKTFAFHQSRSPWLRWNPLGWGILFVLAVAGAARLATEAPKAIVPVALLTAATAASVVFFFVSARFRLPLAALATIFAGGALAAPKFWISWPGRTRLALAGALAIAALVTFSSFDHVSDRATFVQDHALLARAADTVGNDALAWDESLAALALQPMHRDALRLAVASYFNQLVRAQPPSGSERQWKDVCVRFLSLADSDARDLQAVAALALWRANEKDAALAAWRNLRATPSAVAARLVVNDVRLTQIDENVWRGSAWQEPLVRIAALRFNIAPPPGVALGNAERAAELAQKLFASQVAKVK